MAESRVMATTVTQQQQVVQCGARSLISSQEFARSGLQSGVVVPVPCRRRLGGHASRLVVVNAGAQDGSPGEGKKDPRRPSEGIFSFVTDNDSSRNAIQLPNAPAQDGNLGQMITVRRSFLLLLLCPNLELRPLLPCDVSHSLQLES